MKMFLFIVYCIGNIGLPVRKVVVDSSTAYVTDAYFHNEPPIKTSVIVDTNIHSDISNPDFGLNTTTIVYFRNSVWYTDGSQASRIHLFNIFDSTRTVCLQDLEFTYGTCINKQYEMHTTLYPEGNGLYVNQAHTIIFNNLTTSNVNLWYSADAQHHTLPSHFKECQYFIVRTDDVEFHKIACASSDHYYSDENNIILALHILNPTKQEYNYNKTLTITVNDIRYADISILSDMATLIINILALAIIIHFRASNETFKRNPVKLFLLCLNSSYISYLFIPPITLIDWYLLNFNIIISIILNFILYKTLRNENVPNIKTYKYAIIYFVEIQILGGIGFHIFIHDLKIFLNLPIAITIIIVTCREFPTLYKSLSLLVVLPVVLCILYFTYNITTILPVAIHATTIILTTVIIVEDGQCKT